MHLIQGPISSYFFFYACLLQVYMSLHETADGRLYRQIF